MNQEQISPVAVENFQGGLFRASSRSEQRTRRHHDGELRHQNAAAFDAAIHSHAPTPGDFCLSDSRVKIFWNAYAFQHSQIAHVFHSPRTARHYSTISVGWGTLKFYNSEMFFRRAAECSNSGKVGKRSTKVVQQHCHNRNADRHAHDYQAINYRVLA